MSKIIGGTLLVSGTSIGAAMIAMPITAAKIGFFGSILLMIIIAWVMYYLSQISLEIFKIHRSDSSIAKISGEVIGKKTQFICSVCTLLLLMSLLVAYISGLGEVISTFSSLDYKTAVLFLVIILFLSLSISHKIFDYYNRLAFSLKLCVIVMITIILTPYISTDNLAMNSNIDIKDISVLGIIPVFVTSFGFHGSIPFIYKLLDHDESLYKKATTYGCVITLLVYILWLTLTFGSIQHRNLINSDESLSNFILLFQLNSELLSTSIKLFALLAILTSLFGVAVGVYDFIAEILIDKSRFIISGITFLLPAIFCLLGKSLFITALSFAGCALTIIAIIIPTVIRFKLGGKFNKFLLILSFIIGIMTILSELTKFL